jgi:hypothetical protein
MRQYPRQAIGADKAPARAGIQLRPLFVSHFPGILCRLTDIAGCAVASYSLGQNAIFTPLNLCLTMPILPTEGKRKQSEHFPEEREKLRSDGRQRPGRAYFEMAKPPGWLSCDSLHEPA